MKNKHGFTLLELMIVVAIIAIIAAIALPNLLRGRAQANEATAIENLRVITAGQISYHTSNSRFGVFDDLVMGEVNSFVAPGWFEGRQLNGYTYSIPSATAANFLCTAAPVSAGASGIRYFRTDASGIIRHAADGAPGPEAPAIGEAAE